MERKLYYFAAISITIAITIGSLISVKSIIELPRIQFFDKVLHTSAYFLLTLSWLFACHKNLKLHRRGVIIALLVFVYGIVIEVLQGVLTTFRQADLFDIFANLGGIIIALVFFSLILKRN